MQTPRWDGKLNIVARITNKPESMPISDARVATRKLMSNRWDRRTNTFRGMYLYIAKKPSVLV